MKRLFKKWTGHWNARTGIIINKFPEDALLEILSKVPACDLIQRCRLVCTLWRDIIDSPAMWKRMSQQDGLVSKHCQKIPPDWKMFYFLHKKKRNLRENPSAAEGIEHRKLKETREDHFRKDHGQPFPDTNFKYCFTTEDSNYLKKQLIDLEKEGYPEQWMDVMQPDIVISDGYIERPDFGPPYMLCVQLLSKEKTIIQEFLPGVPPDRVCVEQWNHTKWYQMEYRFKNYGPGVRYIHFQHGGNNMYCGGLRRAQVTKSSITIEPENLSI